MYVGREHGEKVWCFNWNSILHNTGFYSATHNEICEWCANQNLEFDFNLSKLWVYDEEVATMFKLTWE